MVFTGKKEANNNLVEIPADCLAMAQAYQRSACLLPYFSKLTMQDSAEAAITQAQQFRKQHIVDDCHLIAHQVGHTNFEKYRNNTAQAFVTCPLGCIEGCFHGVMESYAETRSTDQIISEVPELCSSIGTDWLRRRQCIHGVGHGLLRHQLSQLESVVGLCRQLPDDFHQETCLGGVFMENMNNYLGQSLSDLQSSLPRVCESILNTQEQSLIGMCLQAMGEGLMFYTGHDLARARVLCSSLESQLQNDCYQGAETEQKTNLDSEPL